MKVVLALSVCGASGQDVFLASRSHPASLTDLARASTRQQSGRLGGSTSEEIADKINGHLSSVAPQRACQAYSLEELNNLMRSMFPHLSQELSAIYDANDGRSRRFGTLAEYEQSWEKDAEHDESTLKDAKCAETLMLWAHHLSETGKVNFGQVELPTLPAYDASKSTSQVYADALSCQTGHAMKKGGDGTSSHQWPDWPEELHYKAMGHGAYPFWWTGFSHEDDSAPMEAWWSEKQGAEKFYHSSCHGAFSSTTWLDGSACYHLMLAPSETGTYKSYLYNEDAENGKSHAEGARCCTTNPSGSGRGPSENLGPAQGTFWKTFQDKGEVDFDGVYYKGKAHYYVMTGVKEPVADFWYFTDLDGKPVQQGEAGTGPTDQGYPSSKGHTIWHDYDPSTLDSSAIAPSVFKVPAECLSTTTACAFP